MTAASIDIETQLSDADVERMAQRTAELLATLLPEPALDPEMLRPMGQQEAAEWLGIDPSTVWDLRGREHDPLPCVYLGMRPKFCKADLVAWLRRQQAPAGAEAVAA